MSARAFRIVFVISVLLNVFLITGSAAGLAWLKSERRVVGVGALRVAGAELPSQQRQAFRQALQIARSEAGALVETRREARHQAAALLRMAAVDQQALAAALGRVREAELALREHLESRTLSFVASLPQVERSRLADHMEARRSLRRGY